MSSFVFLSLNTGELIRNDNVLSVERFYPDYFTAARPTIEILPDVLTYGGNYFDVKISAHDLGSLSNLDNTKVTIIRTGFSTHAINMGQRYLQLFVLFQNFIISTMSN